MTPPDDDASANPASGATARDNVSPADRLLDLFVFAPAGLALTVVEELPSLVEKGRNRIEGRTATARVVGQFAVQIGCREVGRRLRQILDSEPTQTAKVPPTARTDRPDPARTRSEPAPRSEPTLATTAHDMVSSSEVAANGHSAAGDLAIPAYDTLSASQVVKLLAGLSRGELTEVGDHERANRHRATILTRVEQLLADEPSNGST